MAALSQYNYIFAIGTVFAFLDAWNIGANDVANSWATSVASRSVTYIQAMILGGIMECTGAIGAGARVTDTIRTKIVSPELFEADPAVLMLGMLCAVIASACFLTMATRIGFPVSTTHSILGGVLGMGIAAVGVDNITWVNRDDDGKFKLKGGVVAVLLSWIFAPIMSGGFAAVIFLITKYVVLLRRKPVMFALYTVPVYFGITASLLCMLVITKGGQIKNNTSSAGTAGIIVGTGVGFAILVSFFLLPWIYRKVVKDDWELRWYHVITGPLVLLRGEVPPPPSSGSHVIRDFYAGHLTRDQLDARRNDSSVDPNPNGDGFKRKSLVGPKPEGKFLSTPVLFWYLKWLVFRGVDKDVINSQKEKGVLTGDLEETHARADHFDNKVEYIFAFLQVMTAATASFTHGANDVANAIGPYISIYQIWQSGEIPHKKATVPVWILAFGGGAIIIALPVSTTQCITGATVAVGLCNGTWRAINWRMVSWIDLGWIITLPIAGIFSGCMMAFIINAPRAL